MPNLKNTASTSFRLPARAIAPTALGALLLLGVTADAGDILRGGAPVSQTRRNATAGSNAGADLASQTQNNATDRLARTTQALNAMKNFQAAARQAAQSSHARIADPNHPGRLLPFVPNGLRAGGLQVADGVPKNLSKLKPGEDTSLWVGAGLPKQTTEKDGGKNVTIIQNAQQALLTWKTFNIGKKTTLTFDQSAGGSDIGNWVAFNKINDPSGRPSQILGSIKAGGQVYVVNRNGVIFGGSSQVNTHTLVASGLRINDNLISQGLLDNPNAEFLFNSNVVESLLGKVDSTTPTVQLGQEIDPTSVPVVTVTVSGKTQTLTAGTDYAIATSDGQSAITFTSTKLTDFSTTTPTALSISYYTRRGAVVVEPGATLTSPTTADHVGGRIMLAGSNVINRGTISTPDGQTILAAGLQVGINAHKSSDPSLRGLDVFVGAVADPSSKRTAKAGRAINSGFIDAPHANVTITGKNVRQNGVIDSSTTVSLNGSVNLIASYDAAPNPSYNPSDSNFGGIFNYQSTGAVSFGKESVTRILPEIDSTDTITGALALPSQAIFQGKTIHLSSGALVLAPNASVAADAGNWYYTAPSAGSGSPPTSQFVYTNGQIYLDSGALIDVAGSTNVAAPLSENILTVQFRGSELANSPLQRNGPLRAIDLTIDIRNHGTYNGSNWIGTPLADATGFASLIKHNIGELTTIGGSVTLHAGGSVVLQSGSTVDVSGGWLRYGGGFVQTSQVVSGSQIIDIANATPDQVYSGIYDPKFTTTHSKWGISQTFGNPLSLSTRHYESGYISGSNGGSIAITAPAMAIDGKLAGNTTAGPRQQRDSQGNTNLPEASRLSLAFQAQDSSIFPAGLGLFTSPTPPRVVFGTAAGQDAAAPFALDSNGDPIDLGKDRRRLVVLSPDLVNSDGFGSIQIDNSAGRISVPEGVSLTFQPGAYADSSISNVDFKAMNIDIRGDITAPGGRMKFTVYDFSPYKLALLSLDTSASSDQILANSRYGNFVLGQTGRLSTAGLIVDDRESAAHPFSVPIQQTGGSIAISTFTAKLLQGSVLDVSGGAKMTSGGQVTYGKAGSISIAAGSDPGISSLLGGKLILDSTLLGYSGSTGGTLAIQAPLIRVASIPVNDSHVFNVTPDFFDRGGFASFSLTGVGSKPFIIDPFVSGEAIPSNIAFQSIKPTAQLPGLVIEPDTVIAPMVESWLAQPLLNGGKDTFTLTPTLLPQGLRSPVSLSFASKNVSDVFSHQLLFRGDLQVGEGVRIDAGPLGSVSFSGDTVSLLGAIYAPGGSIKITGADSYPDPTKVATHARTTVYLGSQSILNAAGAELLVPDNYGRRRGSILAGGSISISGNILGEAGAVLDVSGTSGILDLTPAEAGMASYATVPVTSGIDSPLYSQVGIPTVVDSNAGTISLTGGEQLFVDSHLYGAAGGPTARGGILDVSSGIFQPNGVTLTPRDINLIVRQSGSFIPFGDTQGRDSGIGMTVLDRTGKPMPGRGYFAIDEFTNGGFDSLSLGGADQGSTGVVRFVGPVDIHAREKLSVAGGGVIYATDNVSLSAPYVQLGTPFLGPLALLDTARTSAFNLGGIAFPIPPHYGTGTLTVHANLIDVGNLSLQQIGSTQLFADGGDIRGDGTFEVAGRLYLQAGQIYPVTDTTFTIGVEDYFPGKHEIKPGQKLAPGTIEIASSGNRDLPLSAGGILDIYGSKIIQGGTLRAPLGTINLGWDGSGDAPKSLLSGRAFSPTEKLVLEPGSITSVSAADSGNGMPLEIPYGIVMSGTSWIDPAGIDITGGGVPTKNIVLGATHLVTQKGSTIDIRGGGDLYAYRWVSGQGGTADILASTTNSFAVLPGYQANYAPFAPFNTGTDSSNLSGDPGYVKSGLSVGDQVYLSGSSGLSAGVYTLLPARYALLPGAVLVTPKSGSRSGTLALPDGSSLVSGYQFNSLAPNAHPEIYTQFEVAPQNVVRARAAYEDYFATSFLRKSARALGTTVPRLPLDAGHLVFEAATSLRLQGCVLAQHDARGIGAYIDISSPGDIVITGGGAKVPSSSHALSLDAGELNAFGAESLLIGGIRTDGSSGTTVDVTSSNITVANAGVPLAGPEIILTANDSIKMDRGAAIQQSGSMQSTASHLLLDGNGALLRVSSDPSASISRTDITNDSTANLILDRGATLSGTSIIVDSSSGTSIDPKAHLLGDYVSLDSGQISLRLNGAGDILPTTGLVLAGQALSGLQGVKALSLLSYSSIDIYGAGNFRIDGTLALHAAEIRGFNSGGNKVSFSAGSILLDNSGNGFQLGSNGTLGGTLAFNAGNITLGSRNLHVDQYSNLLLSASDYLDLHGSGHLTTEGDLSILTPAVIADNLAVKGIIAQGAITLSPPKGSSASSPASSIGASLTIEGSSILANSNILLPSGHVTLHSTTGNLSVGGNVDVSGTAQTLYDLVKYTDAGTIDLIADQGSVNIANGSTLSVAAQANGGNAGAVLVSVPNGSFNADGTLLGKGGSSGKNGSFSLDVSTLPNITGLSSLLDKGSFTESRSFRVRNGDVTLGGNIVSRNFELSTDAGSITVAGLIDASGETGGTINLSASGSLTLAAGAKLDASGKIFDSAGKGGAITLEAGDQVNGTFDPNARLVLSDGSVINLSVAANTANSTSLGRFTGTLHLRAPQDASMGNTDLQMDPVQSKIIGASAITVEGYQLWDLSLVGGIVVPSTTVSNPPTQAAGGLVTNSAVSIQQSVLLNGQTFGNNSDAIKSRLFTGANASLAGSVVVMPGAEIINRSAAATESLSLSPSGSLSLGSAGGTIYFPQGTSGDNEITSSISGTIVTSQGQRIALNGATPTSIPAGASLVLSSASTISFASGSSGSIPLTISPGTTFTASPANSSATISGRGTTVSLNSAGSSKITLSANSSVLFITGTPGTRHITSTVSGTIVDASGNTTTLAANTPTSVATGSTVTLNGAGTLSYVSGGFGAGTPTVTLLSGNFTTSGAVGVTSSSGDLTLGSPTTTGGSDWNLAKYRFGPQSAPGVLTLRAAGNLVFYNSLQDGFDVKTVSSSFTAPLLPSNALLPLNAQSWSYQLTAGADLGASDFHRVASLANLASGEGSLLLGKNAGQAIATPLNPQTFSNTTASALGTSGKFYQVIRTGSGNIDISAGRDVVLQNQFATIYTAGTLIDDPTMNGKFDVPILNDANSGILGGRQQRYTAQYSIAGGDISISAQNDISHVTKLNGSDFATADSSRQLPINWLMRRGFVDPATGEFGAAKWGDIASTSWWVNFSNFFEGVGALGGGDVSLYAGHDVMNVDAVAPTNARMPQGKPNADNLVELGGGDVTVQSGHDINGGVYYAERGNITLQAGHEITTNSTRSPSLTNLVLSTTESSTNPEATWLPTTLFLGKGSASVTALGNVLMGPVANPFLLPGGFTNTFWYKTYFSTYAQTDAVDISSIGGSVTLRESATLPFDNSNTPILEAWLKYVLLLNPHTASYYQPWLRITETNVDSFTTAASLLPSTLRATAFSGDINLIGNLTLAPSSRGTIDLAAAGAINGLQPNGVITSIKPNLTTWASSMVNLSDASPSAIPGTTTPFAYQALGGTSAATSTSGVDFLSFFDSLFAESGSINQVLQTKQTLHSSGPLHLGDSSPVHLYAAGGDISGVTLFSSKFARVIAAHDLTDISLYIQNTSSSDISVVSAGHDIVAYDANSLLRTAAQAAGNELDLNNGPLAGDIQINGPGTLEVLAGRNLDLGTGSENLDGTGSGITSIGNLRNPYLSFQGASIVTGAGIGLSNGLEDSHVNFSDFIAKFLGSDAATQYLSELSDIITPPINSSSTSTSTALLTAADLAKLTPAEQSQIALDIFFLALRDAGRNHNDPTSPAFGTYSGGLDAIMALFGKQKWRGDIKTESRDIRTKNGGDIAMFAPGGSLTLANSTLGNTLTPPGIITEYGGNISIFTDGNVDLGIGRIFTLRGGNEIIWSTNGNIAAGAASKTVASAPPVSVLIDPQSANVKTNLAGLSTGGGIGVLATVAGVAPGDVDLIAPNGVVDAGDASIRASGNLNIAAVKVLNASNISVGGNSMGVPSAPVTAAPNVSGLSSGASATGATSSAANDIANQARQQQQSNSQDQNPSIYEVDVLGYGGGDDSNNSAVSAEEKSTSASLNTAPSPTPDATH